MKTANDNEQSLYDMLHRNYQHNCELIKSLAEFEGANTEKLAEAEWHTIKAYELILEAVRNVIVDL